VLSQWRGYCPPAGGYCLGIESQSLIQAFATKNFTILPCVYNWSSHSVLLEDAIDTILPGLLNIPPVPPDQLPRHADQIVQWFFGMIDEIAPIIKHPGFAEEKEWRAVSAPIRSDDPSFKLRPQGGLLKPYFEVPLDLANKKVRVVVGPIPHVNLAMNSCTMLLGKIGTPEYSVRPSAIPFRTL